MQQQQEASIYKVSVNGEQRKALDLIALKQFLETKKLEFSLLSLDPDKIDNMSAMQVIAKAAVVTLSELEFAVDKALGLVKEEPQKPAEQEESEEEDDGQPSADFDDDEDEDTEVIPPKPKNKATKPSTQPLENKPQEKPKDVEDELEEEEKIVL